MFSFQISAKRVLVSLRRNLRQRLSLQLALLLGFWMAGSLLVHLGRLPIPAGIAGMFLVLALLATGRISLRSLSKGAGLLISEMLLFFVPAVLAVLDHREFLGLLGLKLLAAILVGIFAVMCVTALTADLCFWLMRRGEGYAHS